MIYLTAFFTSGDALTKCLVCRGGDNDYYCEVGETGESEECGGPVKSGLF